MRIVAPGQAGLSLRADIRGQEPRKLLPVSACGDIFFFFFCARLLFHGVDRMFSLHLLSVCISTHQAIYLTLSIHVSIHLSYQSIHPFYLHTDSSYLSYLSMSTYVSIQCPSTHLPYPISIYLLRIYLKFIHHYLPRLRTVPTRVCFLDRLQASNSNSFLPVLFQLLYALL